MARLLAFPFRVAPNGSAATVEADTDDAYAQELAILLGTRLGERPLAPEYGVDDATFGELDEAQVVAAVEAFMPDTAVRVLDVETDYPDDRTADVLVTFAT